MCGFSHRIKQFASKGEQKQEFCISKEDFSEIMQLTMYLKYVLIFLRVMMVSSQIFEIHSETLSCSYTCSFSILLIMVLIA